VSALVQTKAFVPLKATEAPFRPIGAKSKSLIRLVGAVLAHEQHEFPEAFTSRAAPLTVRDEMLEFYAFVFCERGFRQLGMTFEQFLLVAPAFKAADLLATAEEACTL
jgi:hypothetical protein